MIEFIGWLGSFFLAICGAPLALNSLKNGHSEGISMLFLWLWLAGEVLVLIYVPLGMDCEAFRPNCKYPVIFNVLGNILFIGTVAKYKFFPRKKPIKSLT